MLSFLRQSHRNGRLYLGLSAASALGAATLALMNHQETQAHQRLQNELGAILARERERAKKEEDAKTAEMKDRPALWDGVLMNADARLQGHLMLRNVKVGTTVEILQEQQGPDQRYLTVRDAATGHVGWYPADWVRPKV